VVRVRVERDGRTTTVEVELNPGRANRARVNGSPVQRARDVLGILRTVVFAPEDLALVKGDPGERRRFLDELLVARAPRWAGVRADYDRVQKQRTALLKSAGAARRAGPAGDLSTLEIWDAHLARAGAALVAGRMELVEALRPLVDKAYAAVSAGTGPAGVEYKLSVQDPEAGSASDQETLEAVLLAEIGRRRKEELDRGVCLVGPHRDDLVLSLGSLPAKGYASHGESWSMALALKLASYDLLSADGGEPVLILDDVFAELDTGRRARLAELVAGAEQVLITAAVGEDVPSALSGARVEVADGTARHV
jgi:DNA replication and repair protein RecF